MWHTQKKTNFYEVLKSFRNTDSILSLLGSPLYFLIREVEEACSAEGKREGSSHQVWVPGVGSGSGQRFTEPRDSNPHPGLSSAVD